MLEADENSDNKVDFDEFLNTAACMRCAQGIPTDDFNSIVKLVAKIYVGKRDNKARACARL